MKGAIQVSNTPRLGRGARRDRGAIAIIVAVFAIVAMILLAFVIDRGRIYVQRTQLQNAVDAAALAAVRATCANPIADSSVVRAIAVDYGERNGVTVNEANVIVRDGANDTTTGVSVAAEQVIPQFFGGFAGVSQTTVAARGTATRLCRADFQFVATTWLELTASPTVNANIFGGQCFVSGPGGTYNGIIAVSEPETFTLCDTIAPVPNLAPPIYIFGSGSNQPVYGPSFEKVYDVDSVTGVNLSAETAFAQSSKSGKNLDTTGAPDCDGSFSFGSTEVRCSADGSGPDDLKVQSNTVNADIVAAGTIAANGATFGTADIFIYSAACGPSNKDVIVLPNVVPSNVFVYAPCGKVKFTGSASQLQGVIYAKYIEITGGGGSATAGDTVRVAGPWRLSQ